MGESLGVSQESLWECHWECLLERVSGNVSGESVRESLGVSQEALWESLWDIQGCSQGSLQLSGLKPANLLREIYTFSE